MKIKNFAGLLLAILGSFLVVISANAQGTIIPIICDVRPCRPIPRPRPLPNVLPIKSINVDVKINGQVATTHVEQVFRNDTSYTLEGTYFFPIPEAASIVEFAIWENGKKLVAKCVRVKKHEEFTMKSSAANATPDCSNTPEKTCFKPLFFRFRPNSDKKLEITFSQVLKAESGTVAYRYPLGTGNRAWVNQQPIPVRNVDYDRGGNNRPDKLGVVSGKIEITSPQALRNIYSPTHNIDTKMTGENKAVMTFESNGKVQDFQLFYGLSNNDFGLSLLTYREPGKDGYFLLILSPKDKVLDSEIVSKDIVFVLDTSGSMADEGKMEKARKALLFGVRNLRDGDRFNVINFAGEEHLMENGLISANETGKKRGEDFVNKLRPVGGTNINDALRAAMKQFDNSDRPKLLVFMTDGLPTVGETNVQKIIQNAKDIKVDGLRLFTFGVGYDVNTQLLDKIASENSGAADYVEPKEDLEVKVSNFFSKVNYPVLTDVNLNFANVQADLLYPRKTPDLFKGTQLTLMGRYKNDNDLKNITLRLTGKTGRENRTFAYENLDFPLRAEDNNFLPRLWATRRVGWLMEQIRSNGEQKELRDEVVELGTRYGIVTPYTSYLATDGSDKVANREDEQPMPTNSSRMRGAKDLPMAARKTAPMADSKAISGQGAVLASKNAKEQQETVTVSSDDDEILKTGTVQKVSAKTFYLESDAWIDSEFKAENKLPEIKLTFASSEYFELIGKEKEIAKFFALGEQVVVVYKGKVYRVTK